MSVDVSAETTVRRPRGEVADFASDPSNDTRWIGGIRDVRVLSDGPMAPGVRVERVARFLGRRIEYVLEVEEYAPGSHIRMRSVKGPFPMRVTYAFADAGDGTAVRIRVEGDAGGFYRLAGSALSRAVRRSITRDLATLKRLLEPKA